MHRWPLILIVLIGLFSCSSPHPLPPTLSACSIKKISPIDFLSNKIYKKLELDIIYETSCKPDPEAIAFLCSQIQRYCKKESIKISQTEISIADIVSRTVTDQKYFSSLPLIFGIWQPGHLAVFTQNFSQKFTRDETLVLHIIYVPGIALDQPIAIGEAFASDSFVIFRPRIQAKWERSILLHEFGHLVGLTDNHSTHSDKDHSFHCSNKNCVMFWCVGDEQLQEQFDEDCLQDLYTAGAKKFY